MSLPQKPMRYAHADGFTDLVFVPDDSFRFLTSGADGEVRIWKNFDDDDPITHSVGDKASALACLKDKFFVAAAPNVVRAYKLNEGEFDGTCTRFTLEVNAVAATVKGGDVFIAAGGADFAVKMVNVDKSKEWICSGHAAPILSLAFDPKGVFLASSSCDGTVRLWNIDSTDCVKTFVVLPKCNEFGASTTFGGIVWTPGDGQYVVLPAEGELQVLRRDTWQLEHTLKHETVTTHYSLLAFSPCGTMIAATATEGVAIVWNFITYKVIASFKHPKNTRITALRWAPKSAASKNNVIMFCDEEGQMGVFENIGGSSGNTMAMTNKGKISKKTTTSSGDVGKSSSAIDDDGLINREAAASRNSDDASNRDEIDDDEPEDFPFNLDEDIDADDVIKPPNSTTQKKPNILDDDDDDDAIDLGALKASYNSQIFGDPEEGENGTTTAAAPVVTREVIREVYNGPPPPLVQKPFQPSSTPVHWQHRFMLWNSVGIVRSYESEDESAIDVEFHDAATHHALHLTNQHACNMAALSREALLLAAPKGETDEERTHSVLLCVHFGSWDNNKEWLVEMPKGEDIQCITVSDDFAAAATDSLYLRVFALSGIQLHLISIGGLPLCMAAINNQLMIVYHSGAGLPDTQNLSVTNYKITPRKSIPPVKPVALSMTKKAQVAWAGYSDEGSICYVDSFGIVRLLDSHIGHSWLPICNLVAHTKTRSDTLFVVGLSQIRQNIRCIPCKGARYPAVLPRPAVTTVSFGLPLCDLKSEKSKLEEEYWRTRFSCQQLISWSNSGMDVDEEASTASESQARVLLKMFAMAARSGHDYRAIDIARLMDNDSVLQGAIQYAARSGRRALAERVSKLLEDLKAEEEEEEEQEEMEPEVEPETDSVPAAVAISALRDSRDDDFGPLQPKLLRHISSDSTNNSSFGRKALSSQSSSVSVINETADSEILGVSQQSETTLQPMPRAINPFKASSQQSMRGSSGEKFSLDSLISPAQPSFNKSSLLSTSTTQGKEATSAKKVSRVSKQTTLSLKKADNEIPAAKSAFELFKDSVMKDIQAENPNGEMIDWIKAATSQFKALSADEKKQWAKKAMELNATSKKRKAEDDNEEAENEAEIDSSNRKKSKTSATDKLSSFAFDSTNN